MKDNKKYIKPAACTSPPWAAYIEPRQRADVLRKIRQDCIDELGYDLDECPKRKTCLKKECMGRPMPWFSETAKPYLEKMVEVLNIKPEEEYFIETNCNTCPFVASCKKPCNQVIDYIERDKTLEPKIEYEDYLENLEVEPEKIEPSVMYVKREEIPWDVLSEKKKITIEKYLFEQRDFRYVAKITKLYNQAAAKYEFYAAMNKLSEFAVMRKFINENVFHLTPRQYEILNLLYNKNMKKVEVAKELNISKQSVQQTVARVVNKFGIKWHKFVRKEKNKIIYNTVKVLQI